MGKFIKLTSKIGTEDVPVYVSIQHIAYITQNDWNSTAKLEGLTVIGTTGAQIFGGLRELFVSETPGEIFLLMERAERQQREINDG
tara:strand:- start:170 stop:427 length:258 start_codon:yes stop_codon:yes gene_type:complete